MIHAGGLFSRIAVSHLAFSQLPKFFWREGDGTPTSLIPALWFPLTQLPKFFWGGGVVCSMPVKLARNRCNLVLNQHKKHTQTHYYIRRVSRKYDIEGITMYESNDQTNKFDYS